MEFKKYELTKGEKIWLRRILIENFYEIDVKKLKVELFDELPNDFVFPNKDNMLLKKNIWITALGIWYIDQNNKYLCWTEEAISVIRKGIKEGVFDGTDLVSASYIKDELSITLRDAEIVLRQIYDLGGFFSSGSGTRNSYLGMSNARFNNNENAYDEFLKFDSLEMKLEAFYQNYKSSSNIINYVSQKDVENNETKGVWVDIKNDYGLTKKQVGRKIGFVKDRFKRGIIFRDIEHAYLLSKQGFDKASVILSGGVTEELLRLYLIDKKLTPKRNDLGGYINLIKGNNLFDSIIQDLANVSKEYRNSVHLEREKVAKDSINKSKSKAVISWLFILIEQF